MREATARCSAREAPPDDVHVPPLATVPTCTHMHLWQGFYKAISTGYNIGWGYPVDPDTGSEVFSIIYILVGASFVAAALGYFAHAAVEDHKNW